MSEITQRTQLQAAIWRIADDVRGAVDGWDFKQFVLGALFYRYISENFAAYMEGGNSDKHYAEYADSQMNAELVDTVTREKGYFIYPSQLFAQVVGTAESNPNLNTELAAIFTAIEASAVGYASERAVKGLFTDFDTTSPKLGNTVEEKNRRLCAVLRGVEGLDFGHFADHKIDLFGDAYEFLISNYAANAGKSGGEFFTPQTVSKLIARLALSGQTKVNKIYDPACGSGSLLLQAKQQLKNQEKVGFVGQEINHTTFNLARMNLFLHNVNYTEFDLALGDTLLSPQHRDTRPFDAIVSNPPYSVKWVGSDDPTLINDERFAPAGVLAPKGKADFAFILHALNHLSARGRAAIVCFPGIFYRGGAEQKIRQYLVDNNFVETVIALAPNLFFRHEHRGVHPRALEAQDRYPHAVHRRERRGVFPQGGEEQCADRRTGASHRFALRGEARRSARFGAGGSRHAGGQRLQSLGEFVCGGARHTRGGGHRPAQCRGGGDGGAYRRAASRHRHDHRGTQCLNGRRGRRLSALAPHLCF